MHRLSSLLLSATVFLIAVASVTLLSRAPFGEIYATLLSIGEETGGASITLYGATKPEVNLTVAEKDGHPVYTILAIEDQAPFDTPGRVMLSSPELGEGRIEAHQGQATPAFAEASVGGQGDTITLTVPGDWHLEEVRGAHASDIAEYGGTERLTLIVPMREPSLDSPLGARSRKVELRFTVKNTFSSVAFSHDAESPALFTLTQLDLPGGETTKKVQLVESAGTVEM